MKVRNLLMIFALIVSTGAACSSGSEAERADETAKTQEKAQTEKEATDEESAADEEVAGGESAEDAADQDKMAGKQGMMQHCPMAVENTEVVTENTDKGVAMVFTTSGDVDELRKRVQWMADHHGQMMKGHGKKGHGKMKGQKKDAKQKANKQNAQGEMKGHGKKGHGKHGMMAKAMAATSVSTEQVDQGMKLVFTAEDDAQVEKLQQHIARHVEQVNAGSCPMKYNKTKGQDASDEG